MTDGGHPSHLAGFAQTRPSRRRSLSIEQVEEALHGERLNAIFSERRLEREVAGEVFIAGDADSRASANAVFITTVVQPLPAFAGRNTSRLSFSDGWRAWIAWYTADSNWRVVNGASISPSNPAVSRFAPSSLFHGGRNAIQADL